jgi:RNA:NAD 2'-phosphotransferase (TPT1/KptA family)/8-oxo-dGTP pyrophosphatase MutT (NUDIX family)
MTDLLTSPQLRELRDTHVQEPTAITQVTTVLVVPAPIRTQKDLDQQFLAQVRDIVSSQVKQRLTIFHRPDGTEAIKANYGHNARLTLEPGPNQASTDLVVPKFLFHGTSSTVLTNILRKGLIPMGRHAVHATACRKVAMTVAQRHIQRGSWPVILRIDTQESGGAWTCSADTWLTPAVSPKCLDLDILKANEENTAKTGNGIPCAGIIVICPKRQMACLVCTPPSDTSPGIWGFPKGKRNSGEGTIACALRECQEETGLRPNDFRRILPPSRKEKLQEFSERGNVAVQFLVGVVSRTRAVAPQDPTELASAQWMQLDQAKTLLTHKNRCNLLYSAWRLATKIDGPASTDDSADE